MSQGRPQPPLCYRLFSDASGQSETVGVLLLLAITVLGTTAVVAFGSQAMTDIEESSNLQRTEQTMTLLDSRGAMVALGDSEQQDVDFSHTQKGGFEVKDESGWISIDHMNYTEDEADPKNEELYNESMGALVYESSDTEIAYQGGGVWRVEEGGQAQMISKPEFHYRGATLTLPLIRMDGTDEASGDVTVSIKSKGNTVQQFPNPSRNYNGTDPPDRVYANPIKNGTVNVTVHSEYYLAWAEYFRSRTDSTVTVYHNNQTVTMKLLTLEPPGQFGSLSKSQTVAGYPGEHKITDFTTTVQVDKNNWEKVHWSWYVDKGSEKFELHVSPNGGDCSDMQSGGVGAHVFVMYQNQSSDETQEWEVDQVNEDADIIDDVDCSEDSMRFNFTATDSDSELEYRAIDVPSSGNDNHVYFDDTYENTGGAGVGTATFDHHDEDTGVTYEPNTGQYENISYIINHYFARLGPSFELEGIEGPGNSGFMDPDESDGFLDYEQSDGQFLTYLHITENEVEVEAD